MADVVTYVQWASYAGDGRDAGIFERPDLSYNSRQSRLHEAKPGDRVWLVSRCPRDQQYYFVAILADITQRRNPSDSELSNAFGEFSILADRSKSHDLAKLFPAEGLLRALEFDPVKPVKHGANLGQSLQAIRVLSPADTQVLDAALSTVLATNQRYADQVCALWTKCEKRFSEYFLGDWEARQKPVAFMLYDAPPTLPAGAPVFIHADKAIRLVARFIEAQYVHGHKITCDEDERVSERDRVWAAYREKTVGSETKAEWDRFWIGQNGVRAFFLMDQLVAMPKPLEFKSYSRLLGWGYPTGVGYRYLNRWQTYALLRAARLPQTYRIGNPLFPDA